jgi:hypothetical protein
MKSANISFTKWVKFGDWKELDKCDLKSPGVYAIAYTGKNILNKDFDYIKEIVYFGMTNSIMGLKGRLGQFDATINKKLKLHGGAQRVKFNLAKEDASWKEKLFVSIKPYKGCDVNSNKPEDLEIMGEIAKQEYICFSKYVQRYNELPRFNDKKKSPKK